MRLKVAAIAAACLLPAVPAYAAEMIGDLGNAADTSAAMAMGAVSGNGSSETSGYQDYRGAAVAQHQAAAPGILIVAADAPDDGNGLVRDVLLNSDETATFGDSVPWQGSDYVSDLAPAGLANAPLSAGAVPEPGTWALLIAGFGAVGTGLRLARRRRSLATI